MSNLSNNIYEKTSDIPIQKSPNNREQIFEQSLNLSFFDPSFHSPPNNFRSKLYERMQVYENNNIHGETKKLFNLTKA
jgi:hypothetical protein